MCRSLCQMGRVKRSASSWSAWTSRHDLAVIKSPNAKLHNLAFHLADSGAILRACGIFSMLRVRTVTDFHPVTGSETGFRSSQCRHRR